MDIPDAFAESDPEQIAAFVERHSFGLLVSQADGAPLASHLPFLVEREAGRVSALVGHLARANPQWRSLEGQTVLALFSGPHAYISPAWYEAENVVPTWNYVAVHVYGVVRLVEEPTALTEIVRRFVATYEAPRTPPWTFDADSAFAQRLLPAIVGFRLDVTHIEGKWKLSQNHPAERREKVALALAQQGDRDSLAIAELMRQTLVRD